MTITFSLVQSASNQADPASATFGATPTEGNKLVVAAAERSGQSNAANYTISGTGWTQDLGVIVASGDATFRRSMSIWTKTAGASEPTNIQVDDGTANTKQVLIMEISAGATVTWTFEEAVSSDNGTTADATSLATGTTGSLSAAEHCIVGVIMVKQSSQADTFSASGATMTLTQIAAAQGGSSGRTLVAMLGQDSSSGTKSSTITVSAGNTANAGLITGLLVFSAVEGGGGGVTNKIRVNKLRPAIFKSGIAR